MEELIKLEPTTGLKVLPHWLAQPYFRIQSTCTSTPMENVTKKEPKRVHGSGAGHESEGEGERDGNGERASEGWQEGAKRVKLMTVSAVPLPS